MRILPIFFTAIENTSVVTQGNVVYLHEPENMLSSTNFEGKEVASKLITKFSFIKGSCSNKFSKASKPKIYFIDEQSFSKHHGIPSMALVLQRCLGEKKEDDVAILCSDLDEVNLVQSALDTLEGKRSRIYVPSLEDRIPTSKEKKGLLNDLDSNNKLIVISDYRAFRGCETSHSIIITDLEEPLGANIFAEMLSRTIVDLDFVALPKKKSLSSSNQIEKIFNEWKQRDWVENITVLFKYEYETDIAFQFNSPPLEEIIQKDPNTNGFTYTQRGNQKPSKETYM